jgi:predicted transcriptional regulator
MDIEELTIMECPDCEKITLGGADERSECCDRRLRPAETEEIGIESPGLGDLLGMVFGMNETELDVCLCVMDVGEATTRDIAAELDVDRSHVSRHLNHLVDLGVLEKRERLLEAGGRVNVYTPASLETVRRNFTLGLVTWFTEAVDVIEGLSREKVEAIEELADGPSEFTIYQDTDRDAA